MNEHIARMERATAAAMRAGKSAGLTKAQTEALLYISEERVRRIIANGDGEWKVSIRLLPRERRLARIEAPLLKCGALGDAYTIHLPFDRFRIVRLSERGIELATAIDAAYSAAANGPAEWDN